MDTGHLIDSADDPRDQLIPYVLGELTGDALAQLEAQLVSDPSLRAELDALEQTSLELMAAVPHHVPPPRLKANVMDAIAAASAREAAPVAAPAAAEPMAATPAPPRQRQRRRWSMPSFALPAMAGGLAIACGVLAFMLVDTRSSLSDAETQLAVATQQSPPISSNVPVSTSEQFATARGRLVRDGDEWVLVFVGVPDPGKGASWQVWTADKQGKISNVAQWTGDDRTQVLSIDHADDIGEVMVSHEHTTTPVEEPSGKPVAIATT